MFILGKVPTNLKPETIPPNIQLELTLHSLGHGCTYSRVSDMFRISISSACQLSNHVCRIMIAQLYTDFVNMPRHDSDWKKS